MKSLYWRPRKISPVTLSVMAVLSLAGLAAVELLPRGERQPWSEEKLAAAQLAARGMDVIKQARLDRGQQFDPQLDPAQSGLIGDAETDVTSVPGSLAAKQTSINPNFAAAVVDMLKQAGVHEGDCVAVGCSGSFPAINICVYAALETLHARPIVIASASGSQFGANRPDLLWIDMERLLHARGCISFRTCAASLGDSEDRAVGMSEESRGLLRQAIDRNGVSFLDAPTFAESIDRRMAIFQEHAAVVPITAYVNVGGGTVSVGRAEGKHRYEPGLNLTPPPGATSIDSVMTRFMQSGVPVIHMVEIQQLAARYGLPRSPATTPTPGTGGVFARPHYNRWLATAVAAIVLITTHGFVLQGWGPRVQQTLTARPGKDPVADPLDAPPELELMV